MPLSKRSRGERDAPRTSEPTGQQHLYLIFDDWELGYSIRKLNLPNASNAGAEQRRLPPPFIRLEAEHGCPEFFAAVGTKILATHPRRDRSDILPMIDVRSRGVNFAPGDLYPQHPIYLPVDGDEEELFALDKDTFKVLSMKQVWPPRLEHEYVNQMRYWSWRDLPMPTLFNRMDVTSYAVDSDGRTILASTAAATFAFDPLHHEWEKRAEWSLPFSGRANFVDGLDIFVGLPKDEDNAFGRLCFCRWLGDDDKPHVWFSKENLSSKGPGEGHVGTTLVYLGKSMFCLVECVRNGDDEALQKCLEKWEELDHTGEGNGDDEAVQKLVEKFEELAHTHCCLTTFSLSSDMNGDVTVAETAVQCYKLPVEASANVNPAAFCL